MPLSKPATHNRDREGKSERPAMLEWRHERGRETGKRQEEGRHENYESEPCLGGTFKGCICCIAYVERHLVTDNDVTSLAAN